MYYIQATLYKKLVNYGQHSILDSILDMKTLSTFQYAKPTGQSRVRIPEENKTTFFD